MKSVDINILPKHLQKEYAHQKNAHLDILNHVDKEKTAKILKLIVCLYKQINELKYILKSKESDIEKLKSGNESISVKLNEVQDKSFPSDKSSFTFDGYFDFETHLKGIQHNIPVGNKLEIIFSDWEEDDDFREKCFCVKEHSQHSRA